MKKYLLITTMASSLIGGMSYGSATAGGSGWSSDSEDDSKPSLARRLFKAFDITSSSMTEEDFIVREAALLKRELDLQLREMAIRQKEEELSIKASPKLTSYEIEKFKEKELIKKAQEAIDFLESESERIDFELKIEMQEEEDIMMSSLPEGEDFLRNNYNITSEFERKKINEWEKRMTPILKGVSRSIDESTPFHYSNKITMFIAQEVMHRRNLLFSQRPMPKLTPIPKPNYM